MIQVFPFVARTQLFKLHNREEKVPPPIKAAPRTRRDSTRADDMNQDLIPGERQSGQDVRTSNGASRSEVPGRPPAQGRQRRGGGRERPSLSIKTGILLPSRALCFDRGGQRQGARGVREISIAVTGGNLVRMRRGPRETRRALRRRPRLHRWWPGPLRSKRRPSR